MSARSRLALTPSTAARASVASLPPAVAGHTYHGNATA